MRCEYVDPATNDRCPNEATRRTVGGWNPFGPGTKGDAAANGTMVCDDHDSDPTKSIPLHAS